MWRNFPKAKHVPDNTGCKYDKCIQIYYAKASLVNQTTGSARNSKKNILPSFVQFSHLSFPSPIRHTPPETTRCRALPLKVDLHLPVVHSIQFRSNRLYPLFTYFCTTGSPQHTCRHLLYVWHTNPIRVSQYRTKHSRIGNSYQIVIAYLYLDMPTTTLWVFCIHLSCALCCSQFTVK